MSDGQLSLDPGRSQHEERYCRTHSNALFHVTTNSIVALCARRVVKVLHVSEYMRESVEAYLCPDCRLFRQHGSGARTVEQAERVLPQGRR